MLNSINYTHHRILISVRNNLLILLLCILLKPPWCLPDMSLSTVAPMHSPFVSRNPISCAGSKKPDAERWTFSSCVRLAQGNIVCASSFTLAHYSEGAATEEGGGWETQGKERRAAILILQVLRMNLTSCAIWLRHILEVTLDLCLQNWRSTGSSRVWQQQCSCGDRTYDKYMCFNWGSVHGSIRRRFRLVPSTPPPPILPFPPTDDISVVGLTYGIKMLPLLHKLDTGKWFHLLFWPCYTPMRECRSFSVNSCSYSDVLSKAHQSAIYRGASKLSSLAGTDQHAGNSKDQSSMRHLFGHG